MRRMLLAIGNVACADDGIGPEIARQMAGSDWRVLNAAISPENVTGLIVREAPELLVVVDAADMNLPPGAVRRIPHEAVDRMLASTHGLPLGFLIERLRRTANRVVLVGVQPERVALGEGLSPSAALAARKVVNLLQAGTVDDIPRLRVTTETAALPRPTRSALRSGSKVADHGGGTSGDGDIEAADANGYKARGR